MCFVGAVVILYITSQGAAGAAHLQGRCHPRRGAMVFPWSRLFGFSLFSHSCRTRSGCPGCAVASSAKGAVLSMNVAVLTQRQVPAALCAGWAPGPFIDLSVGSVSGIFYCDLVVVNAPFGDECGNFFESAIQTFLCGGSRLPFGSGAIPFRETLDCGIRSF